MKIDLLLEKKFIILIIVNSQRYNLVIKGSIT